MLGDLILSIVLIVISTLVLRSTSTYPDYGSLSVIGPEVFPNIIAYFLLIASAYFLICIIYKAFIKKTDAEGNSYLETEKAKVKAACNSIFKENLAGNVKVVITILLVIAYGMLLGVVGYEILTIVFLVATMFMNGIRKPQILIIVPVVAVVVIYVFFVMILKVQLPRMIVL